LEISKSPQETGAETGKNKKNTKKFTNDAKCGLKNYLPFKKED